MIKLSTIIGASLLLISTAQAEWTGQLGLEQRVYAHSSHHASVDQAQTSVYIDAEYYREWNKGNDAFVFKPYLRIDSDDNNRTAADIRELKWIHVADSWEMHLGWNKVFWGVTESQHLVDVINQSDLAENIDGEDKLGQLMARFSFPTDYGTFDTFIMPDFRERRFPARAGRLRTQLVVDEGASSYEDKQHIDHAIRWSHSMGIWDMGLSYLDGTNRDPVLTPALVNGQQVLTPHYEQMQQTGIDVQATVGSWLYKLETIRRKARSDDYTAMTGGFEYTLYGINSKGHDLGVLLEYSHDSRDQQASTFMQDDVFLGARWIWNDSDDTTLLVGVISDSESAEHVLRLEAETRLSNQFKLSLEAQVFSNIDSTSPLTSLKTDDVVQVQLAWYF